MSDRPSLDQISDVADRREAVASGNRGFTTVAIYLRRWLKIHRIDRDYGPPVKMTIEVPDTAAAAEMLYALKSEFDLMTLGLSASIDLDQPFKLMGIEFMFKQLAKHDRRAD